MSDWRVEKSQLIEEQGGLIVSKHLKIIVICLKIRVTRKKGFAAAGCGGNVGFRRKALSLVQGNEQRKSRWFMASPPCKDFKGWVQPDEDLLYISESGRKTGSRAWRKLLLCDKGVSDHHPQQRGAYKHVPQHWSKDRRLKPRNKI